MTPGPAKSFDPEQALARARDVFWRRGYAGTAISELESAIGVGRKSLYDTFGSKRALYLRSIEQYTETVIGRICRGLADSRNSPMENLERVLNRLQEHHGSEQSLGCLLGVAMAQTDSDDTELQKLLLGYLKKLETAFTKTLRAAQADGAITPCVRPQDAARQLVALTQGMALLGRIQNTATMQRSIVRSTLQSLRA
jgi:TetR/AcrR family transcriptional regulator, transcriptional repressor for nem operon